MVCWLDPTSTAGKCGDCKKKGKPCEDVSSEIRFGLSHARARMAKKRADEQNVKTPWAPVVASTSQVTSEVVAAVTGLGRRVDRLAEILLEGLDEVGKMLEGSVM